MQIAAKKCLGEEFKFEIARLQPVQERCAVKMETLINQEEIIVSLVEEVNTGKEEVNRELM